MKLSTLIAPHLLCFGYGVVGQRLALSTGCGKALPARVALDQSRNLTIDSLSGASPRKYRLHIPPTYDPTVPVPMIVSFHGRNKDMEYQEELSQFSNASYGFEGIAVYPEGVPSNKGTKQWQGDPNAPDSINDVTFTLELIDHLMDHYCIDTTRIYASGKSNGGGFTGVLACDPIATQRIAAFAAVSGAFYLEKNSQKLPSCNPTPTRGSIPIMELHGAKDNTIHYEGGLNDRGNANTTSVPAWVNVWAERNGFDANSNTTSELCLGPRKVTTHKWNETVVHYLYKNMYHDWPSQYGNGDTSLTTCAEADGTRVILDWFRKWRL